MWNLSEINSLGKKTRAMLVFSSYSNAITLFSYERSKSANTMGCLHGIRAISSQWIVFLHTALSYMMQAIRNVNVLHQVNDPLWYIFIKIHLKACVEFPVLPRIPHDDHTIGSLCSRHIFRDQWTFGINSLTQWIGKVRIWSVTEKPMNYLTFVIIFRSGKINVLRFYVHRYLRLTPLLAVVILFTVSLFRFLGNGPFWFSTPSIVGGSCEQYWWSALLHIQNYVNPHAIVSEQQIAWSLQIWL